MDLKHGNLVIRRMPRQRCDEAEVWREKQRPKWHCIVCSFVGNLLR
jgi:hypothetical protein